MWRLFLPDSSHSFGLSHICFVKASERIASLLGRVETTSSALCSLDETCLCRAVAVVVFTAVSRPFILQPN